jgi:hypothetical protein
LQPPLARLEAASKSYASDILPRSAPRAEFKPG